MDENKESGKVKCKDYSLQIDSFCADQGRQATPTTTYWPGSRLWRLAERREPLSPSSCTSPSSSSPMDSFLVRREGRGRDSMEGGREGERGGGRGRSKE